jgi:cytochrome c oxidase subunit 2
VSIRHLFRRATLAAAIPLLLTACAGQQSALDADGVEAGGTLTLTGVMTAGAFVILAFVCVVAAAAILGPAAMRRAIAAERFVVGWGLVFPVVVVTALLVVGLAMMRTGPAAAAAGQPTEVTVSGEQWWWRITYEIDGREIASANELLIPVGRPVRIALTSPDVIHSFWVPAYAGKVDMIPGRTNTITLHAETPGLRRGQCAEYCGGAHALMAFTVLALEPDKYEARLRALAEPAASSRDRQGEAVFLRTGCGGCHAVRGTAAAGLSGPDLTHVGGRATIGAGILPAGQTGFAAWIGDHPKLKPDTYMPAFDFLTDSDVQTLARYLASLE